MIYENIDLPRTVKLEVDEGAVATVQEAMLRYDSRILQIHIGIGLSSSPTRQAAALTAVNVACRAFGEVRIRLDEEIKVRVPWGRNRSLSRLVLELNGKLVSRHSTDYPTLIIGDVSGDENGTPKLYVTWDGWTGGVVPQHSQKLAESIEFPLAGTLAGAVAVSEAFQLVHQSTIAGHRPAGISLWKPGHDWMDVPFATGPVQWRLPAALWLVGLGHLGQAYAWTTGMQSYPISELPYLVLQDHDIVELVNFQTGLLLQDGMANLQKTEAVAQSLARTGYHIDIRDEKYTYKTRRRDGDPNIALFGVDNMQTRNLAEHAGFNYIIDAGLGAPPEDYLGMALHTFPASRPATSIYWQDDYNRGERLRQQPAYQNLYTSQMRDMGLTENEARCGVIEHAGHAAGAAFVGVVAASLALAEVIRADLPDGYRSEVLSLSLQNLNRVRSAPNHTPFKNDAAHYEMIAPWR